MIVTKMSALVYFFFILFNSLTVIFGNNHVPVLLWSPTVNLPTVPGLKQINSVAFHEILHDTLAPNQPVVAVFIEEKLSNEDFRKSSDDINAHASLEALTTGSNVAYFPSVTKPLKTIEHLTQNGYSRVEYTGNLPSNTERLLLIVPLSSSSNENNEETVSNVYNELRKQTSNILAIYTGQESIRRRPRRDAEPKEEPFSGLVVRTNTTVLMFESLQYNESAEVATNLTSVSSVENSEPDPNTHIITVTFNEGKVVKFNLSAGAELWSWSIRSLEVEGVTLYSDPIVGAPFKWSYFCGKGVTYAPGAGNKSGFPSLTFTGLQAQAFMDENSFGQAVDCIPYFNIEIWTGLFVVFLMLFILTWGLQMLMDVNTNDRFDDPKGKTITISATD